MTYLDYIIFFQKLDRASNFSAGATRLYLKLLDVANGIADGGKWPVEFAKSDPYMRGVCGASQNPFKEHRKELEERGLVATMPGGNGAGNATTYRLLSSNKVSDSDTLSSKKLSESDTITAGKVSDSDTITPKNGNKVSDKVSESDTPYIEREKEKEKSAAPAAVSVSTSDNKSAPKRSAKKGLDHEAVAALPMPHPGAAFASLWRTFYTANTHQQAKPVSALELLLKKLGGWPEGAAIEVLEAAIGSNWSGFSHDGAKKIVDAWLARPAAASPAAPCPVDATSVLDPDAVAAHEAAHEAAMRLRIAERRQRQAAA